MRNWFRQFAPWRRKCATRHGGGWFEDTRMSKTRPSPRSAPSGVTNSSIFISCLIAHPLCTTRSWLSTRYHRRSTRHSVLVLHWHKRALRIRTMAALKRVINLSRNLKTISVPSRHYSFQTPKKSYFTYVNEPSMPIPGKEPCWLKTADEAIEQAELDSGNQRSFTRSKCRW